MDRGQADQIAHLLNSQNHLMVQYTADKILEHESNYLVRLSDNGRVIACAELKAVQWYQYELLHVTVAEQCQRNGLARSLVVEAEKKARERGARILQSTIRSGNNASEGLFASCNFTSVCRFYNESSGKVIGVWQKVLAKPPAP